MTAERLSMRAIREVLRLRHAHGMSQRAIAQSIRASPSTVWEYLTRAQLAGISWPLPEGQNDEALEQALYPPAPASSEPRAAVECAYLFKELKRKHVTLQLLWQEYKRDHPEGYQYTHFCNRYRTWRKQLDVPMHQEHKAGDKVFVDYSGDGIPYLDAFTGTPCEAQLFLAVLGASNYTYADVTPDQTLPNWIGSHMRAYEYFGGVTAATVPDNPKTGVTKPCYYEPELNPTYQGMAEHYDTAIIPARPYKPRDKAKVESGVLVAQRWIIAALRNQTFIGIEQVRAAVAAQLEELNSRPLQKLKVSRRALFETIDRPALKPLPATRFEYAEWCKPTVNIDYHVEVEKHYYSVPYRLRGKKLEARYTASTVEVFHQRQRVAAHARSFKLYGYTTLPEHMPPEHQRHLEWSPSRIRSWAATVGATTVQLVEHIMATKTHPEQGYRACLGILRLGKKYGNQRVEAACTRAVASNACSYRSVKNILAAGLDRLGATDGLAVPSAVPVRHYNIRGSDYYH